MKFKQLLAIVGISAATAVGSVAAYNHFIDKPQFVIGSADNGMPANYAGFFDGKGTLQKAVDLTKAAGTAVPAVVHIKTRIPGKKANQWHSTQSTAAARSTTYLTTCSVMDQTSSLNSVLPAAVC
jgi:hypothetical protein